MGLIWGFFFPPKWGYLHSSPTICYKIKHTNIPYKMIETSHVYESADRYYFIYFLLAFRFATNQALLFGHYVLNPIGRLMVCHQPTKSISIWQSHTDIPFLFVHFFFNLSLFFWRQLNFSHQLMTLLSQILIQITYHVF